MKLNNCIHCSHEVYPPFTVCTDCEQTNKPMTKYKLVIKGQRELLAIIDFHAENFGAATNFANIMQSTIEKSSGDVCQIVKLMAADH